METINKTEQNPRNFILDLMDSEGLTSHFQPIYSAGNGGVFGYEALCRMKHNGHPAITMDEIFNSAISLGLIAHLDFHCRDSAMHRAVDANILESGAMLFINICPETMQSPEYQPGLTDELAECWGLPKDRIVLEITEQSAVRNWNLFCDAVRKYRSRGYKIAIDDFGAGYGGLKMLSLIRPDFVKIDRHFISNLHCDEVNRMVVDSLTSLCHRIGISVIAEGIENAEECSSARTLGADYLQGYHLGRPAPGLALDPPPGFNLSQIRAPHSAASAELIGDIVDGCSWIPQTRHIFDIFKAFRSSDKLGAIAVVEDSRPIGMIFRRQFMEKHFIGNYGYGMHLNAHTPPSMIMRTDYVSAESSLPIDEVAKRLRIQRPDTLLEDICVTDGGRYLGTVSANAIIAAIAKRNIELARGANPLTGLPGNIAIEAEITRRLSAAEPFSVCYIDIDNFKPYNDHYGFERGDIAIKAVAEIIEGLRERFSTEGEIFAGHVGGDDFIVICPPACSARVCDDVIARFVMRLPELHGDLDCSVGHYRSMSRKGEEETYQLLSLSIGIVSTEAHPVESYAHLASIASDVKKAAKRIKGNSIVRDRRGREPCCVRLSSP